MATLFPFPSSKAQVRAMSSANWTEVPGGRGLASMVSKLETTAYPALFLSKTKLLPSVYQISSGFVRGSSDNFSHDFVQLSKVSRQEWKGTEPSGIGKRAAELRTSQGDIVRPRFSISTAWYLRIFWSDTHKWPLPFRSCFTWWLVKIVCPQKRVLKHLLSGLRQLQDFKGREASLGWLGQVSWISKLQSGLRSQPWS